MQQRWVLIIGLCTLIAVNLFFFSTNEAEAASGNGPYYATPSWDQRLAPATRFIVLMDWSSQAVLDRETGLVWEQSPSATSYGWINARLACTGLTTGGRKGWRLPSIHELASLVDPTNTKPALPTGHPFTKDELLGYWSATTDTVDPTTAWVVIFDTGTVFTASKLLTGSVWCVRGGNSADAY